MTFSNRAFQQLVREAIDSIPRPIADLMQNIVIDVEDEPDRQTLREMDIDDPTELLGLYHGIPLTERHADELPSLPDRIVIYKRNIELCAESREEVIEQIRTTVLHEIGHFFGMSEEELDDAGYG